MESKVCQTSQPLIRPICSKINNKKKYNEVIQKWKASKQNAIIIPDIYWSTKWISNKIKQKKMIENGREIDSESKTRWEVSENEYIMES